MPEKKKNTHSSVSNQLLRRAVPRREAKRGCHFGFPWLLNRTMGRFGGLDWHVAFWLLARIRRRGLRLTRDIDARKAVRHNEVFIKSKSTLLSNRSVLLVSGQGTMSALKAAYQLKRWARWVGRIELTENG